MSIAAAMRAPGVTRVSYARAPTNGHSGAAQRAEPGSHIPEAGVHGFRARRCAAPRNDSGGDRWSLCANRPSRVLAIVWRFAGDRDVVDMTLAQPGVCDANEAAVLLHLGD